MSKTKKLYTLLLIISLLLGSFTIVSSAYEYIGTDNWVEKSTFESEIFVSEAYGKTCISVNSKDNLSVYDKALDEPITADGNIYELCYKIYVPHVNTNASAGKQTFILEGRTDSGNIPVLYGIRIDNGSISYYNGTGAWSTSLAYNGNEKMSIDEGKWHTFKTILDRSEGKCRYYVDGKPLVKDGEIIDLNCYSKTLSKTINKITLSSRNVSNDGTDRIYVSDIYVRRIEKGYEETYISFDTSAAATEWSKASGNGSIALENIGGIYGNAAYISSSGKTTMFTKPLNNAVEADNGIYSLSYDVYLPDTIQPDDTKRQSVEVLGFRTDNTVNAYYGPKIINRQVYYYTGLGNYDSNGAYLDGDRYILEPGWHRVETRYDRATETFSYYIDGEALRTPKGDNIKVKVWKSAADYKIGRVVIGMRNDYAENVYIDNIYLEKLERKSSQEGISVYNARLKNEEGEKIDFNNVSGEENLTLSFDYSAQKNFTVLAGVYKDGSLIRVNSKRIDVTLQGYVCGDNIDITVGEGDNIKLIALDSISNIKPYSVVTNAETAEPITIRLRGSDVSDENFTVTGDETSLAMAAGKTMSTRIKAPVMSYDSATTKLKRFDSTAGGPEEAYYLNFKVNNKNFLNRYDGAVYAVTVKYYDDGYGCFTLEYNSKDESFKEAEYVELNNTKKLAEKTFYLKNAWFTGEGTDFRIATWGENMRYSNFDVVVARVTLALMPYSDRFSISALGNAVGNIYYTGDTATFTVKLNDKSFYDYSKAQGNYTARIKYSLVDENGKLAKNIGEKNISITPLNTVTDTVSFNMDKYGLYYLKTEVISDSFDIKSENLTELSYVRSDKTTVNPDYGISFQNNIYSVSGSETLAKNAGIGMLRWVRPMKSVMKIIGKDENAYVEEIADSNNKKYSSNNQDHEWRTLEAIGARNGYTFLNNISAGGMVYSDKSANGYKMQIPYGQIGRNLFADYCGFIAKNAPSDTRYYEIWNEFDSGVGSTFNMNGESWETYGDILVKASDAIYREDENADIVAMSARFIATNQLAIDRVNALINAGKAERSLADYFKNASIHPYHWNENPMKIIPTEQALKKANVRTMYDHMAVLKKLYNDNGLNNTKLWISELAWSPHFISKNYQEDIKDESLTISEYDYKPITEKQQGSYLVQSYVMAKKNNVTEKFLSYLFVRQTTARVDRDKNCGILKYYKDNGSNVPLAATSAYLAIANMNMLMTGAQYVSDFMFSSDNAAAYRYTKADGKDLAILWSTEENGENVSVNLGTNEVILYDEYGNAQTLTSDNGIYSLKLTQSTVYIEGTFGAFAKVN